MARGEFSVSNYFELRVLHDIFTKVGDLAEPDHLGCKAAMSIRLAKAMIENDEMDREHQAAGGRAAND